MKVCPLCAEEIQDAAIVCKHCKRDLVQTSPAPVATIARAGSSRKWWLGLGILGLFLVYLANDPSFQRGVDRGRGTATEAVRETPNVTNDYLRSVIYSTGEPCPEVTRQFLQGTDKDGTVFWNATCQGGQSYVVRVDTGDVAKVMSCIDMRRITNVECFKTF
jgi:hypothetical protein